MVLERPRFSTTKLREGYDIAGVDDAVDRVFVAGVDDAVDRVFVALADGATSMTASDVSSLRFTPVRLAEGYDMGEVDGWLDRAAAELGRTSGGAAPAASATSASAAYGTTSGTRSEAVTEVRSTSPRMLVVLALVVLLAIVAYAFYA